MHSHSMGKSSTGSNAIRLDTNCGSQQILAIGYTVAVILGRGPATLCRVQSTDSQLECKAAIGRHVWQLEEDSMPKYLKVCRLPASPPIPLRLPLSDQRRTLGVIRQRNILPAQSCLL